VSAAAVIGALNPEVSNQHSRLGRSRAVGGSNGHVLDLGLQLQSARNRHADLAFGRDCARPGPLARFSFILFIPFILAKFSYGAAHQSWSSQRFSNGLSEKKT
jgi:hypothetical protein